MANEKITNERLKRAIRECEDKLRSSIKFAKLKHKGVNVLIHALKNVRDHAIQENDEDSNGVIIRTTYRLTEQTMRDLRSAIEQINNAGYLQAPPKSLRQL